MAAGWNTGDAWGFLLVGGRVLCKAESLRLFGVLASDSDCGDPERAPCQGFIDGRWMRGSRRDGVHDDLG